MKRFILALILALCCTPSSGFCTTKAQQVEFLLAQVRNTSGPLSGGKVYFYAAGTTTLKTVWLDRDKSTAAANPYTLDSNGTAQIYAEGLYKVVIKTAGGTTVYSRDNLAFVAFSDVDATNAQTLAGYFPDTGTTGSTIPVRDANGKLPGDILGDAATLGGYGPATAATASKVAVRDGSGKLAGDVLGNAATATLAANSSLVGGFAASQTPTAGNVTVLNGSNQLYLSGTGAISVPRDAGGYMVRTSTSASKSGLRRDVNDKLILGDDVDSNNIYTNSLYKVWHNGNDGAASGMDTDLWQGQTPTQYRTATAAAIGPQYFPTVVATSITASNGTWQTLTLSAGSNGDSVPTTARFVIISSKLATNGSNDAHVYGSSGEVGDSRVYTINYASQNTNQDGDSSFYILPLKNNGDGTATFRIQRSWAGGVNDANTTVSILGYYI